MKPPRTSPSSDRLHNFRSPDYYPAGPPKGFRDVSLGMLLFVLLAAGVVFGIVLVTQ